MDDAAPLAIEGLLLELLAAATRQGHSNGGTRDRPAGSCGPAISCTPISRVAGRWRSSPRRSGSTR